MDNLKITKKKKYETLVFSNNVIKEDIRGIKKELLESLQRSDRILIEFDGLKKTDIFFVQLLCSAHKYAVSEKKFLEISKELPETLKKVLKDYGFYRDKGCIEKNKDFCFWLNEVTNV